MQPAIELAPDPGRIARDPSSPPAAILPPPSDPAVEARALSRVAVRLGVVTALRAEADCLRGGGEGGALIAHASGGSGARARRAAEQLCGEAVAGLVSFGLASGLAPVARPGDVVIGEAVVLPGGGALATDCGWRTALLHQLAGAGLNVRVARVAGSDEALASVSAKRKAFQATFAAALDTESHAVAEVALAAGLPLLVVRAIADPAEATRPPIAFAATGADGGIRALAVAGHLATRPWEIPAAWRFARNRRMALEALRRVAALGPAPFAFAAR